MVAIAPEVGSYGSLISSSVGREGRQHCQVHVRPVRLCAALITCSVDGFMWSQFGRPPRLSYCDLGVSMQRALPDHESHANLHGSGQGVLSAIAEHVVPVCSRGNGLHDL